MTFHCFLSFTLLLASVLPAGRAQALTQSSPRERLSLNDGWRFQKDDRPGNAVNLIYEVRSEVRDRRDDGPADAQPKDAETAATISRSGMKPWILPTANPFIKNPALISV